MAVSSYVRLRMFWGALDLTVQQAQTPNYTTAQIVSGGTSAVIGSGVGVRKVTILLNRTTQHAGADAAMMHFDILNITSGSPDDTWISSDYTNAETALTTCVTALAAYIPTGVKFDQFIWHRTGTGVSKPNPAERITDFVDIAGSGGGAVPPQVASSITFRTGVRKSWGRTYMPLGSNNINVGGTLNTAAVDAIAAAVNTMVGTLATNDMHLVVVSKPLSSSLNVERIEVDDVTDVIRRRRWKASTYKKLLP